MEIKQGYLLVNVSWIFNFTIFNLLLKQKYLSHFFIDKFGNEFMESQNWNEAFTLRIELRPPLIEGINGILVHLPVVFSLSPIKAFQDNSDEQIQENQVDY